MYRVTQFDESRTVSLIDQIDKIALDKDVSLTPAVYCCSIGHIMLHVLTVAISLPENSV